jgi:hypothetical protein
MPVELPGKCGITAETKILINIEIIIAFVHTKIAGGVGIPPVPIHSPFVVVEIAAILGSNQSQKSETEEEGNWKFSRAI